MVQNFSGGKRNWIYDHPDGLETSLTNSLVPDRGTGSATFTRATTATVEDFEGIIKTALSGEARFKGARRVENLLRYSEDFSNAVWEMYISTPATISGGHIAPNGTLTASRINNVVSNNRILCNTISDEYPGGKTYSISAYIKGVLPIHTSFFVCDISGNWSSNIIQHDISGTYPEWVRVSFVGTVGNTGASATVEYGIGNLYGVDLSTADFYIWGAQLEDVTGQTNQNPSEYVSVDVESTPWHGANVDGVAYPGNTFVQSNGLSIGIPCLNGNTVASNVVIEATGSAIPASTLKGVMIEGERENLLTYSEDFTNNICWSLADGTTTANQLVAPDGTLSADLIQSTKIYYRSADNPTSQGLTNTFTGSVWVYSATEITINISLYAWGDSDIDFEKTISATTWTRILGTHTFTGETGQVGIAIKTGGNDLYAWGAQLEADSSFPSSYVKTEATAVTRNADVLSYPSAGNIDSTVGSMYMEISTEWTDTIDEEILLLGDGTNKVLYINTSRELCMYDGTNTHVGGVITGSSTGQKIACNWGNGTMNTFINGVAGTESTFNNDFNLGTLQIGTNLFGTQKDLKIWKRKLSEALLEGYTN